MAARLSKGALNSILLKNSSSSLRGDFQRRLYIPTIANHNQNSAKSTSVEGLRLLHNNNNNNNNNNHLPQNLKNTDTPPTNTPTNHQDAPATTTPASTTTPYPDKPCTCSDCHWFPFHRGKFPKLLSKKATDKLCRFAEDIVKYTPISEGPCTPPFAIVLQQRLAGQVPSSPSPPPTDLVEEDKDVDVDVDADVDVDVGNSNDDGKMPRSGYDTTNLRAAQKPRPAGVVGSGSGKNGTGSSAVKGKKEKVEGDAKGKQGHAPPDGPAPLEKRERSWDEHLPLDGRAWTFWL
ncbi:hypothetical protein VM1G_08026 [Cytospora mali]|uniref:Uncharacterized protein n=1 Tax=Cytospora mali TaxID=578113 RepID=A0A194W812_CYTMA|nr:hypothetical protein VM1G_08026 [Valsa mali]